MRTLFTLMLLVCAAAIKAQTGLPGTYPNSLQLQSLAASSLLRDTAPARKWFITKYVGMSSTIGFFNGGSATMLAIPVGIQLNRKLNNNWYAFAGVSAAPAYINFNRAFLNANATKFGQPNNFLQSHRFDLYSRAEMGLIYTNDQKTFSISGSIGIETSSYPMVPFNQAGIQRQHAAASPRQ